MDISKQGKDESQRRRLQRTLALVGVAGIVLLVVFDAWLRHLAQGADVGRALRMLGVASLLLNLAIALVAGLLGRLLLDWARQTTAQGQWPPAGLEWPGPSPLRHGAQALRIAAGLRIAGLASLGVAFGLAAWTAWRILA